MSIIVPVYKTAEFVPKCATSLLSQSLTDLEFIFVDDGSPDNSGAILDELALTDPRVKVIHQANRGLPGARNAGMEQATGEFVGFVDSDDWVSSQMFEDLHRAISASDADVAMCDYTVVAGDEQTTRSSEIRGGQYTATEIRAEIFPSLVMDGALMGPPVLSVCRCLYRRSFLTSETLTFDEDARYSEDYLFSLQVMLRASSFVYLKGQHHYFYRHNPASISQSVQPDAWATYLYLNSAIEREVRRWPAFDFERQLQLHLVYFALNLANRIARQDAPLHTKLAMLKTITDNERLQGALRGSGRLGKAPRTRLKLLSLSLRLPLLYLLVELRGLRCWRL